MKVGLFLPIEPGTEGVLSYLPPLGLGYLSSYAKRYVGDVAVVVERNLDDLIAARPDIVGFSFGTFFARLAARQARQVKEALGCPVLCGGVHVSTLPTVLDPAFDVAVIGEGERTFAELLQLFRAEGRWAPESLRKIAGLLFRDEAGRLERTSPRPLIENLDEIPYPDRDLTFEKWRRPKVEVQLLTGRGCPCNCSFCSASVHWGRKCRMASDEYVLGELELIRRQYHPEAIHFSDDLFITNRSRVLRIARAIRERRLHEGVEFTAFARADLLDDELMEALARTNFSTLHLGLETGSDAVLQIFNKQGVNMEVHCKAIELARKHGVLLSSCFILGAPGETRQDILETFEFVRANADIFSRVHFTHLQVFPGTDVWEWAKRLGISDTNLRGVALDTEDFADADDYLRNRWPYLNEANIPREEMLGLLRLGSMMSDMVARLQDATAGLHDATTCLDEANARATSARFAAENIPILQIVKEKARRRLRGSRPAGQ